MSEPIRFSLMRGGPKDGLILPNSPVTHVGDTVITGRSEPDHTVEAYRWNGEVLEGEYAQLMVMDYVEETW